MMTCSPRNGKQCTKCCRIILYFCCCAQQNMLLKKKFCTNVATHFAGRKCCWEEIYHRIMCRIKHLEASKNVLCKKYLQVSACTYQCLLLSFLSTSAVVSHNLNHRVKAWDSTTCIVTHRCIMRNPLSPRCLFTKFKNVLLPKTHKTRPCIYLIRWDCHQKHCPTYGRGDNG